MRSKKQSNAAPKTTPALDPDVIRRGVVALEDIARSFELFGMFNWLMTLTENTPLTPKERDLLHKVVNRRIPFAVFYDRLGVSSKTAMKYIKQHGLDWENLTEQGFNLCTDSLTEEIKKCRTRGKQNLKSK